MKYPKVGKSMSGKIDISKLNTPPEKHELDTAKYFAELGYDIEFIRPSNIPEIHTPDILMDGIEWEIKCPKGKGKRTIENCFRQAVLQSDCIIFDLRKSNRAEEKIIKELERRFDQKRGVKRLLVIKRNGSLIKFDR